MFVHGWRVHSKRDRQYNHFNCFGRANVRLRRRLHRPAAIRNSHSQCTLTTRRQPTPYYFDRACCAHCNRTPHPQYARRVALDRKCWCFVVRRRRRRIDMRAFRYQNSRNKSRVTSMASQRSSRRATACVVGGERLGCGLGFPKSVLACIASWRELQRSEIVWVMLFAINCHRI